MTEISCDLEDGGCYCLLSDVMELLGKKYVMDLVCIVAMHGRARFGEIESHLPGASTSTLSTRLDELEAAGLVRREQYDEIPPRVEYELTPEGAELGERLEPVLEWVREYDGSSG
ncbi:winged helix-turn-helix transcriptional regulator [Halorientalis halophila]|uniref:winged helix-turn-helix transcriptional regulator n=1 Tax=Halorientalis halophila TaxID=3108499 RepID=UPI00300AA428